VIISEEELKLRLEAIDKAHGENLADAVATAFEMLKNRPTAENIRELQLAVLYTLPPSDLNRAYIEEVRLLPPAPNCDADCGCQGGNRADQCWADPFCPQCYIFGNNFTEEEAVEALTNLGFTVEKKEKQN